jgi:pimeloyl-ACP methyl ester carboxylesterase
MPSFTSRGFSIHYERHGTGSGVPLVLIMGIGATCQGWLVLQVPELSRDRPNVIFDNRGAGRSEDPGEDFGTVDLARDTLALLDELQLERANVLGAFLGGMVAQELAILAPERVHTLTLVGTFARADARRRMLLEQWRALAESQVSYEARVKSRLIWSLHDLTFEQSDIIDSMLQFYLEQDAPLEGKVVQRQIDACLAHDALDRLDQIQAPTLVVCGEQDLVAPLPLARQLANRIPQARLVPIPGAGHLVPVEMARRFNRLVGRFLLEYDGR